MTHLTFLIPVRHPENSRDWSATRRTLSETATSIAAQDLPGWNAIVIANSGSDLPPLPDSFQVEWVELEPNPFHDKERTSLCKHRAGVTLDKGRRILAGLQRARDSEFVMPVDDDDYISRRISGFVNKNINKNGWYIGKGYEISSVTSVQFQFLVSDFWTRCGSCHIVRRKLYDLLGCLDSPSDDFIRDSLGAHDLLRNQLASKGAPLEELPFPGAVYRRGNINSHSDHGTKRGIFRQNVFNRFLFASPIQNLSNLTRIRPIDENFRQEFMGFKSIER